MFPGINPKQMEKALKKMGVKQQEIDAEEVIIKTRDKELIIKNPQVSKINIMGQESLQIIGDIEERVLGIKEDDVRTVAEQTGVTLEEAKHALEESDGDLAKAIMQINEKL